MSTPARTLVIRHSKERLKKCSLRGLEDRADFEFFTFRDNEVLTSPAHPLPETRGWTYLTLDAPPLSPRDADRGLFVLDGTWRLSRHMATCLTNRIADLEPRSIPADVLTAYPRFQTECPDPERGLATVEAIFAAYALLGWDCRGLLDHYHWSSEFLRLNAGRFGSTVGSTN